MGERLAVWANIFALFMLEIYSPARADRNPAIFFVSWSFATHFPVKGDINQRQDPGVIRRARIRKRIETLDERSLQPCFMLQCCRRVQV
jgi:hypothetical protein